MIENCTDNIKMGKEMTNSRLSNERGIALVMMLILSAVALAIMAGLIFMITSGTQISGVQKRYKTAFEAGIGGAELTYQFIALRGEASDTNALRTALSSLSPVINTPNTCQGTNFSGAAFTGWAAKLNTPQTSWSGCDNTMTIDPLTSTTYDFSFDFGTALSPTYRAYAKIVDTVEGNSGSDGGLIKGGVVLANTGEISVLNMPYLYTLEVDAENRDNPSERAKFSILYQY